MAVAITPAPVRQNFRFPPTKLTTVDNTVTALTRNVRNGPATLTDVYVDNTRTSATKSFVKLYNIAGSTLVAGTSLPVIVFPVPAVGTNPAAGFQRLRIGRGLRFSEGISILASKEDGNEMAAAPTSQLDVTLITEK